MSTLNDVNSIGIGPAEIRIGDYSTYVSTLTPVLTTSDYFGYSEVTNVVYSVDSILDTAVDSYFTTDLKSDKISCTIEMNTVEFSKDMIKLFLGLDPTAVTTDDDVISLGGILDTDFRLEILYTYPDTSKHAYFVFPKVKIQKGLNLSFSADAELTPSLTFVVLEETSTAWDGNEYGIIYTEGFE